MGSGVCRYLESTEIHKVSASGFSFLPVCVLRSGCGAFLSVNGLFLG